MSLLSRLRGASQDLPGNIRRDLLVPAVSTMVADGEIDDAEILQLMNLVAFSPVFADTDGEAVKATVRAIIDRIRDIGHGAAIVEASDGLSPNLRLTAFAFAARIALADGKLGEGEKGSLLQTAEHMEISADEAGQILHVARILQHGADA